MELIKALQHAIDGNAILFAGAGMSKGAINLQNAEFKSGKELEKELLRRCDCPEELPLQVISEVYIDKFGLDSLITFLRQEFQLKRVAYILAGKLPLAKSSSAPG